MKIKTPRWTTERFKLAAGAGCFHDIKVEFVGGRLVELAESPEHRNTVENLEELLIDLLGKDHWYVSRESSVEFPDWTPLPDIAVCRGSRKPSYLRRAPSSEDVVLLVEVSQSTYRFDTRVKLPRYAQARVPIVWIINLNERVIEVYSGPEGKRYAHKETYAERGSIPVELAGSPYAASGVISVNQILP